MPDETNPHLEGDMSTARPVTDVKAEGRQFPQTMPQPKARSRWRVPGWLAGGLTIVAENGQGKENGRLTVQWPAVALIVTLAVAWWNTSSNYQDQRERSGREMATIQEKLNSIADRLKDYDAKIEQFKADTENKHNTQQAYIDAQDNRLSTLQGEFNAKRR